MPIPVSHTPVIFLRLVNVKLAPVIVLGSSKALMANEIQC